MSDFHFDFVATNLARKDAEELMDLITRYVGLFDGDVAGGFSENHEPTKLDLIEEAAQLLIQAKEAPDGKETAPS